jgi:hypothetical protein
MTLVSKFNLFLDDSELLPFNHSFTEDVSEEARRSPPRVLNDLMEVVIIHKY